MVNETLILTQNYSSRNGIRPIKFCIHTTQGWETSPNGMYDCAHYFQGNVDASAHYINDNYHPNLVVAGVYEQYAAWTQAGKNPDTISLEQCALAEWSREYWLNNRLVLLQTTAALVRQVCDANGIPIRSLNASEAQDSWTKGVCDHVDFGSIGGGHYDCGSEYPMDKVIEWAKAGSVKPTLENDVSMAIAYDPDGNAHYAWLNMNGQIVYAPPGRENGYIIDTTQKNAKSGVSLAIGSKWQVGFGYTNANNAPCEYYGVFNSGSPWTWRSLAGENSAR